MDKNCNELVEKYILYENPLYVFSFPISLLVGIIFFGISQAYDWSKNSYVNQILIPIAAILLTMVLIDVISRLMISKKEKKVLVNKCKLFKSKKNDVENFESDSVADSDSDSDSDVANFENYSDNSIENYDSDSDNSIENYDSDSNSDNSTENFESDSDNGIENFENDSDNSTENFESDSDNSIENFEDDDASQVSQDSQDSQDSQSSQATQSDSSETYINSKNDDPYEDDDLDKPTYDKNDKPYLDSNSEPYENIDEDFVPSEMSDYSSMNNYNKEMHKTMKKKIEINSQKFSTEVPMDPLTSLSLSPL